MKKTAILLILFLAISSIAASGQTGEKPKAVLFDEFDATSKDVVRTRTERLRDKVKEIRREGKADQIYLFFFYNERKRPSFDVREVVDDTLYTGCLNCFVANPPRITYVDVSGSGDRKVQFWLVPPGAEPPKPERDAARKCLEYWPTPVTLTGTLYSKVFPGPPNYYSIQHGDRKETAIILKLAKPVCTTGITMGMDGSYIGLREMQLVIYNDDKAINDRWWKTVDRRMGKRVVITGTLFGAHTGHQRTKVLIDVTAIRAARAIEPASRKYPAIWFAPINDPDKPDWEILPQEAKPGEVILSKRNELGILSNFAATPFDLDGEHYASVEGFWQMMLYPDGPGDERARDKRVAWKFTREQVGQKTAFEAKAAGTLAEENMKTLGIDWCTYQGKKFSYRAAKPGEHYRLIAAAMRAKLEQNAEVKRILLATGDLILKPDHHGEENPPPEWKYYEMWMQIRSDLQKPAR